MELDFGAKSAGAAKRLKVLLEEAVQSLQTPKPPTEQAIFEALLTCRNLAEYFTHKPQSRNRLSEHEESPAKSLSFLTDEQASSEDTAAVASAIRLEAINAICDAAFRIMSQPSVFITPRLLKAYVETQVLLGRPEDLPAVFSLYANKPVPMVGSSPIKYSPAKPNRVSSAVNLELAQIALDAAIRDQNLPLCLDIIQTTVCAAAFKRQKFARKALIPALGLSLAPLAAYSMARQLSLLQNTMSTETATYLASAGILTYLGATAALGIVTITTANDQMDRVTWAPGTPLRERWIREEERAMLDTIASAWGFKSQLKRGEENSPEWDSLREWIGLRGMILDRTELMEGME